MFIALRHEKILSCYVNLRCCIQMGGWGGGGGDVNLHCIASSEDVVTLQMLLR